MATYSYVNGRKNFVRPQAMLWSDSAPLLTYKDPLDTAQGSVYLPPGYEEYSNLTGITSTDRFIILSDHNREEISINNERIEQRQRMVNGTMRSYHIADKISLNTSWTMIPSRSFQFRSDFNQATGQSAYTNTSSEYTVDGGAGGSEMVKWYEDHTGPFWVLLAYDKYTNFGTDTASHFRLREYNQAVQMYISNFNYSVVKRGSTNHDLWNISVTLEEV